jgi:hypothetical protein
MANLAFIWKPLTRDAKAISLLRDCLTKREQILDLSHPGFLFNSETLLEWEMEGKSETEELHMDA